MPTRRFQPRHPNPRSHQSGFVLIAMSVTMLVLLGMIGLAFDLGRIYIARNEAQVFTDAASMAAAKQLDGTSAGLERARAAVRRLPNRWNLGTEPFENVVVEFSEAFGEGQPARWSAAPRSATGMKFARVTAPDNHLEVTFLRAVGSPASITVPTRSVAASQPVRLVQ